MGTNHAPPCNFSELRRRRGGGCAGNLGDINPGYNAHVDETRAFTLPETGEVKKATFYGYLSAHGCEEFWYSNLRPNPVRTVTFTIEGQPIAEFVPFPYVYAF